MHVEGCTYKSLHRRTVAGIQNKVIKQGRRSAVSRVFHSKNDKDAIAAWRQDLIRILQIFNVRSVDSVRQPLRNRSSDGAVDGYPRDRCGYPSERHVGRPGRFQRSNGIGECGPLLTNNGMLIVSQSQTGLVVANVEIPYAERCIVSPWENYLRRRLGPVSDGTNSSKRSLVSLNSSSPPPLSVLGESGRHRLPSPSFITIASRTDLAIIVDSLLRSIPGFACSLPCPPLQSFWCRDREPRGSDSPPTLPFLPGYTHRSRQRRVRSRSSGTGCPRYIFGGG